MKIANLLKRLKRKFFPSEHDKVNEKWWADGGDNELRFNYNLSKDSFVMDVGGYEGQWASDLFSRYSCNIFVFEPVKNFSKNINKRFKKNSKIKIFEYGLGGITRKDTINICGDGSSIFKKSSKCEEIKIIDVQEWFSKKQIRTIQLMKINIEGGEYELLERLIKTDIIKNIDNIQVQFHNIKKDSRSRMEQIKKKLRKTHNQTFEYEFVWENWTRKVNNS